MLTVQQVFELADAMRYPQHRAMILVAAFAALRWGEVTALRRCDLASDGSWVRVSFAHTEVVGRGIVVGPPKSRAGAHFHDLRHTGNHFAAQTGASTADLLARMGHDDMRAAPIYQRATREADRRIADRMSDLVDGHHPDGDHPHDDEDGAASGVVLLR